MMNEQQTKMQASMGYEQARLCHLGMAPQPLGMPPKGLSKMSLAALMDLGMSQVGIAAYVKLPPEDVQKLVRHYGL